MYISTKQTKDNRISVGLRQKPALAVNLIADHEGDTLSGVLAKLALWAIRNNPEYSQFLRSRGLEI